MLTDKLEYFATSLWKRVRGVDCVCPNCGSTKFSVQDRKYVVTELRRCEHCRLMYRSPSDSPACNEEFYQEKYSQGFTTELPGDAEIERLLAEGFASPHHDYGYYISILSALGLGAGQRLFDYGCSWGYGSWQLRRAGFEILAYEISRPRADFARDRLGIDILPRLPDASDPGELAGTFDCFFSSHVVEHVPKPSAVIELAQALLKPGGYFVAVTPNGSARFRRSQPKNWHQVWGKVHPNLIDDEFWTHALGARPMLLATSPVDLETVRAFRAGSAAGRGLRLDGGELVCVARFDGVRSRSDSGEIARNGEVRWMK